MVAPAAKARTAIRRSLPAIGFPVASNFERIAPYSASAELPNGRTLIFGEQVFDGLEQPF